jgi:hypothetical protein
MDSFYSEFVIGQCWTRKRGRPGLPEELVIRNVYRPDGQVLVLFPDSHKETLRVRELRRNYKPTMERIAG